MEALRPMAAAAGVALLLSACSAPEELKEETAMAGPVSEARDESWEAFPSLLAGGQLSAPPCFFEFSFEPWGRTCREYARELEERGIPTLWSAH